MAGDTAVRLEAGQVLLQAGRPIEDLYLVQEGALEVRAPTEDGSTVPVRTLEGRGTFAVATGASLTRSTADVVARTDSVLARAALPEGGLPELVRSRPEFGAHLARALARTIQRQSEIVGVQGGRYEKVAGPVDELCREFHRVYSGIRKLARPGDGLADLFARADASALVVRARGLGAHGSRPVRRVLPQLGTEELERAGFKAEGSLKTFPPGYEICREGELAHDFFFLFRGRMQAVVGGVNVGTVEAGEFAGEIPVLVGSNVRSASLFTVENCRLMIVEREGFEPLMARQPILLVQLVRSLARRQESIDLELAAHLSRWDRLRSDLRSPQGFPATIDELVAGLETSPTASAGPVSSALQHFRRIRSVLGNRAEGL